MTESLSPNTEPRKIAEEPESQLRCCYMHLLEGRHPGIVQSPVQYRELVDPVLDLSEDEKKRFCVGNEPEIRIARGRAVVGPSQMKKFVGGSRPVVLKNTTIINKSSDRRRRRARTVSLLRPFMAFFGLSWPFSASDGLIQPLTTSFGL